MSRINELVAWSMAVMLSWLCIGVVGGGCGEVGPGDPSRWDGALADAAHRDVDGDAQDAGPRCGNGVREPGEACDGTDLEGTDCTHYGFTSGGLACSMRFCTVDLGDCSMLPSCGDGVRDADEACDDGNGVPWDGCTACQITEYSVVVDDGTGPFWWPTEPALSVAPDGAFLAFSEHEWCAADFCHYTRNIQRFDRQGRYLGGLSDFELDFSVFDIAAAPDGSYLVVWYGDCVTYAQRFLPDGSPVSVPVPLGMEVDLQYCGDLFSVAVAPGAPGTWVAVWERRFLPPGTIDFMVVAQLLGFDGAPLGEPIPIDEDSWYCQHPAVAADATGNLMVAWEAHEATYEDDIWVRRFLPDGTPAGPELPAQLDQWPGYQTNPDVAVSPTGSALVVWQGAYSQGGVAGRFFTAAGTPDASELLLNVEQAGTQARPRVSALPDGSYLVVWQSDGEQDGWGSGVFMRRVDAGGQPVGTDAQANAFFLGDQGQPALGTATDGSAVVLWTSVSTDYLPQGPAFDGAFFVQRYDPSGVPLGLGPTIGP